jgi:hypothetical protein
MTAQVTVLLVADHAARLSRLAKRAGTQAETVAASLLSYALDDLDHHSLDVGDLLDGIPGAYERALLGHEQSRAEKTTELENL